MVLQKSPLGAQKMFDFFWTNFLIDGKHTESLIRLNFEFWILWPLDRIRHAAYFMIPTSQILVKFGFQKYIFELFNLKKKMHSNEIKDLLVWR